MVNRFVMPVTQPIFSYFNPRDIDLSGSDTNLNNWKSMTVSFLCIKTQVLLVERRPRASDDKMAKLVFTPCSVGQTHTN